MQDLAKELIASLGEKLAGLAQDEAIANAVALSQSMRKLGHKYSLNNAIMASIQAMVRRESVSFLGSFKFFQKLSDKVNEFNGVKNKKDYVYYGVQKGAVGYKILVPLIFKKEEEEGGKKVEKVSYIRFKIGTVFDISQTAIPREKLEALYPVRITGDEFADEFERVLHLVNSRGYSVREEDLGDSCNGYIVPVNKSIVLNSGVELNQKLKTLLHELAHGEFGHGLAGNHTEHDDREIEAETTAYVLSQHLGLDSSGYSLRYIYSWAGGDLEKIRRILSKIDKKVGEILELVSTHVLASEEAA